MSHHFSPTELALFTLPVLRLVVLFVVWRVGFSCFCFFLALCFVWFLFCLCLLPFLFVFLFFSFSIWHCDSPQDCVVGPQPAS